MRFRKLTLENFRPFYGINELDLNLSDERNILIVLGKNGHGKTSILKAITWVFYGSSPRERFSLFNRDARKKKAAVTRVELSFEHEGHSYRLIRCITPNRYPVKKGASFREEVMLYRDSTCIDSDEEIAKELNAILPKEASQFFFFDGERIIKYTDPDDWELIQSAIECVLGIPLIRRAVDDMKDVKTRLDQDYSDCLESSRESRELGQELSEWLSKLAETEKELSRIDDNHQKQIECKRKLEVDLSQYESMLTLIEEKNVLVEERKTLESAIKLLNAQKLELTEEMYLAVIRDELNELDSRIEQREKDAEKARSEISKNLGRIDILEDLRKRKNCYCGHELDRDGISLIDAVIEGLRETDQRVTIPHYYSSFVSPSGKIRGLARDSIEKLDALREIEQTTFLKKSESADLKSKITGKGERIDEAAKEKAPQIADKLGVIESDLTSLESEKSYHMGKSAQISETIESVKKKIKRLKHATPEQELYDRATELAKNARNAFSDIVDWMSADKRREIERIASDVHHAVTNKPDVWNGVVIHKDFRMDVVDKRNEPVPKKELSEGEKQVLAFSFIAALARAAKTDTPIVMDSPIIRLDQEHRISILDYLPNLTNQVVLLMIPDIEMRDEYYNLPSLQNHLGRLIRIDFDHKTERSTIVVL